MTRTAEPEKTEKGEKDNQQDKAFLHRERSKWQDLILQEVADQCRASQELRSILSASPVVVEEDRGSGIVSKDDLDAEVIAGGNLNFSYKIYAKQNPARTAIYAKLSLSFALWSPDKFPVDIDRTLCEFQMLEKFQAIMSTSAGDSFEDAAAPVARPLICTVLQDPSSVGNKARLMVTSWAETDEPLALHFCRGTVDCDLLQKVAQAFAKLNLSTDFEPSFNQSMLNYFAKIAPGMIDILNQKLGQHERNHNGDRCIQYITNALTGEALCDMIQAVAQECSQRQQVLTHKDGHVFNILVRNNNDDDDSGGGGKNTKGKSDDLKFIICDWELASGGSDGRDVGVFFFYPMVCALCHAANGNMDAANSVFSVVMDTFWEAYGCI